MFENAFASSIVQSISYNKNTAKINLDPYLEIYVDQNSNLSIEDISKNKINYPFEAVSKVGNTFGFSTSTYWVHFTLDINKTSINAPILEFNYPLIDNLTLYVEDGKGKFFKKISGDQQPFNHRDILYRNFLFNILY